MNDPGELEDCTAENRQAEEQSKTPAQRHLPDAQRRALGGNHAHINRASHGQFHERCNHRDPDRHQDPSPFSGISGTLRIHALGPIIAKIDAFTNRLGGWVGWMTLLMVVVGAFNAVARYLGKWIGIHLSSNAYIEAQWYLFSLIFLLGAAHTLQRDQHVRVDVLYGRLGETGKAWIDLVGTLLFLIPFSVFGLVICWPAVRNSWAVSEVSPDPGGLARYPIKTMMLVCFGLLLLQAVSELLKRIQTIRGERT